jgi:hypothetical protein
MSLAKRTINLSNLDIEVVKPRKAVTGTLLLQITGENANRKASRLAERLTEVLRDYPVKVAVPRRTAELRVPGLQDSVTLEEVETAVAKAGGCCREEVNVGVICTASGRLGSVWIRGPLTTTRKINGSTGGRGDDPYISNLRIGWAAARGPPPRRADSSAINAWKWDTCAGTASQRSTVRAFATGAVGTYIAPGTAWRGFRSVRCVRTWDYRGLIAWDHQRVNHRPLGRGPCKRRRPSLVTAQARR